MTQDINQTVQDVIDALLNQGAQDRMTIANLTAQVKDLTRQLDARKETSPEAIE